MGAATTANFFLPGGEISPVGYGRMNGLRAHWAPRSPQKQ